MEMKLSRTEINSFFRMIEIDFERSDTSLEFLNLIIENIAKYIPWQNITMIDNGLGVIPGIDEIKMNMLRGYGGICLDMNRFMCCFLGDIGYDVWYVLCGRECAEKGHIALVCCVDGEMYFVDFGDAQPYYEALNINSEEIVERKYVEYQFKKNGGDYKLFIKKYDKWGVNYVFNLQKCYESDFVDIIKKYYTDIDYGPFWKKLHFAYYPDKKLRAIKGTTVLVENESGEICKFYHSDMAMFNASLEKYFDKEILEKYKFNEKIIKLEKILQMRKPRKCPSEAGRAAHGLGEHVLLGR